eukprot:4355510-Amphidinium_carterae.1
MSVASSDFMHPRYSSGWLNAAAQMAHCSQAGACRKYVAEQDDSEMQGSNGKFKQHYFLFHCRTLALANSSQSQLCNSQSHCGGDGKTHQS